MPQFINSNISSLTAQRNLNTSQNALNTSLQRLSSGLRINSAKDDAAGLAISERFTSQIRGLNQAIRNANDGVSLAQTAEGALGANSGSLQRIRELAIQSANSTNSASDRKALNNEAAQLLAEVQRVGETTQFNGQNILDGTFSSAQFQVGANANQTISFGIAGATTSLLGAYQVTSGAVNGDALDGTNLTVNGIQIGASSATAAAGVSASSATAKATAINAKTSETGVTATATTRLTGVAPVFGDGLSSGDLVINGISIGAVSGAATTAAQGSNAATAINAASTQTGVTATADASTGALTLTASDGRDIALTLGITANGDNATKIYNAVGLDVSAGGNPGAGNQTQDLVIAAAGEFIAAAPAAGDIAEGDIVTIDSIVYEFTTETQAQVTAGNNPNNIAVTLTATDNAAAIGTALTAAINAQHTAGNSTISATGTTTVVLTQNQLGTAGDQAITYAETFALGATAIVEGVVAANGATDAADGNGVTTKGTLTLSSAEDFTLSGSNLDDLNLATASASLALLSSVDISTVAGSNAAISILDGALSQVSTIRSGLGAIQNRFDSTIANLSTTAENLSAARSRIQDADFAAETAALTRAQILQQAGTSILAQANQLPQNVLSLLQ